MASYTLGNIFGTNDKTRTSTVMCSCPACTGLECLERPRFFAGQLLSEADFNSEIDYVLAKQRLHNRYLHGVGTVCGLEVVCSDCDGQVIIKPGYAIDPCGNDIIVCQEQQFDVIKAIKACCDARKKKSKTGCDPYQPASDPGCSGVVQHWCITVQYQETPTQPITPLRGQQKSCSCGSCSGSCGCGCGNSKAQSNGCSSAGSSNGSSISRPVSCEPTRILESYQLGVVEDPGTCNTLSSQLQGTLFANLAECVFQILNLVSTLPVNLSQIVTLALNQKLPTSQTLNLDAYAACCRFRQVVIDFLQSSEVSTVCSVLKALDNVMCPTPPQTNIGGIAGGGSDPQYLEQVQTSINNIYGALFLYLIECACYQLLPPCPSDPGDNRLVLACVTIKDGSIVKICNFGCRKFAGSFPSLFYWLSLVPVIPLLKTLITDLCCGTDQAVVKPQQSTDFTRSTVLKTNNLDVAGGLQQAFTQGNFALPKMVLDRFGDLAQKFSLQGILSAIPANGLNLATVRGMSLDNAKSSLDSFGITYEIQQVNSRAEIPLSSSPSSPIELAPFAKSGDHVVLYQTQGAIAEVQRASVTQTQTVLDLRKQVETMKADIEVLKAAANKKV